MIIVAFFVVWVVWVVLTCICDVFKAMKGDCLDTLAGGKKMTCWPACCTSLMAHYNVKSSWRIELNWIFSEKKTGSGCPVIRSNLLPTLFTWIWSSCPTLTINCPPKKCRQPSPPRVRLWIDSWRERLPLHPNLASPQCVNYNFLSNIFCLKSEEQKKPWQDKRLCSAVISEWSLPQFVCCWISFHDSTSIFCTWCKEHIQCALNKTSNKSDTINIKNLFCQEIDFLFFFLSVSCCLSGFVITKSSLP